MSITKKTCDLLREKLETALADVAKEMNLAITVGAMRYDANNVSVSLKCNAIPDGVDASDAKAIAKAEFERCAKFFGGDPDWFNREICVNGILYTIVGINKDARKNAFIIENIHGVQFVCDALAIKNGLI